jgi:hypothetical protein
LSEKSGLDLSLLRDSDNPDSKLSASCTEALSLSTRQQVSGRRLFIGRLLDRDWSNTGYTDLSFELRTMTVRKGNEAIVKLCHMHI